MAKLIWFLCARLPNVLGFSNKFIKLTTIQYDLIRFYFELIAAINKIRVDNYLTAAKNTNFNSFHKITSKVLNKIRKILFL